MEKKELILLVSALQKGKKDAAGPIYDAYYNDIYLFILKIVKDPHLASDLTQDTFVEILETIEKLRIPSAFLSWSKMIAYHKCTSYYKKKKDLLADEKMDDYYLLDMRTEERTEFLPDETIDQEDLKRTIYAMLDALPEEQRAAILMRYYDEISIKDIATIQNVSEGTVKSRLNYGRKSIKESVIEYEKKNNIKLHCRGVVPLLLWFFYEDRLDKGLSLTELTPLAETIAKVAGKATKALFKKTFAAVFASLLVTGGVTTVATLQDKPANTAPGISTESSNNMLQDWFADKIEGINTENTTSESEDTSLPENSQVADNSQALGDTGASGNSQTPGISQTPGTSQTPGSSETPGNSQNPENSETPGNPETPGNSETPDSSQTPPSSEETEIPANELPALTLSDNGKYYIVTGRGNSNSAHFTIPKTYNGIPVTHIAKNAFIHDIDIKSITIPNSITHIGGAAFFSTGLTSVVIPDSVISIGDSAFASCGELRSITFSRGMTKIDDSIFSCCTSLQNITIPKEVTHIATGSFASCFSVKTVTVEKGNPVYHSAGNCIIETATKTLIAGFPSSKIPTDGSVTKIADHAVYGMNTLTSITIPEGITSIGQQAFDFCADLKSIYLPASLKQITATTFSYDNKLSDIYYAGTKEQWTSTFPEAKYFLPEQITCTIHCSDGNITN